ncbi:D-alanyl-D-alanine carboxypeptidase [Allokutzneria sp. A3M-2-11 16]|uniref:D-alanyl-D-alanine carboxypeptidase family protein n=1 Tax=Allokutzneria sp. A3M-2-11 16 TaxID=2962043 RepID=UPI0020B85652|nr:D-alanyl-D-alanine carboxypeptidase family protein [Allokutzneria sp. A3M-2-11 16]MCP3800380.1 D-alanyl-D-alanine carboxypeptidase [Allokutzneria sp. A3M-2-11 16]
MRLTADRPVAALVISVCALLTAAPAALAQSNPANACSYRSVPAPPVDTSERPPPGKTAPAPLPVPERPVGGPRLAECGDVLPDKAPALPKQLVAASWIVSDLDTGAVLAAHDPHGRHRPASTIKVLTALTALQELSPETAITATKDDTSRECTCVPLVTGGKYTVRQLVRAMLMKSGNDAAYALARTIGGPGGVEEGLKKMNGVARGLGALDTRAATPNGLDGPGMSTSAYDMALIFRAAMRNTEFAEAVKTRQMIVPGQHGKPDVDVFNDNKLLANYPGALGGKTGFTDDAKHTYVGAASKNGRRLVTVVLFTPKQPVEAWQQGARLLDYGFAMKPDVKPVGQLVERAPGDNNVVTNRQAKPDGTADGIDPSAAPTAFGNVGGPLTAVAGVLGLMGLLLYLRKKKARRARARAAS